MLNLKKLLKSKTFFIPAVSYIGVIVLLIIGEMMERYKTLYTSDIVGLCMSLLILISLPVFWLWNFLDNITNYSLQFEVFIISIVLMFLYHLIIGLFLGIIINFIYKRIKSTKALNINKTNESPELKSRKQGLNRRKFFTLSIIFAFIILIIGSGIYLWKKTSGKLVTIEGKFYIEQRTRSWGMVNGILISGYNCEERLIGIRPQIKLSQKGCPYVNKTVSITGYLSPENCIGGFQCMNVRSMDVKSIKILEEQTTEKQIIIQTDKEAYQQGEMVKITLTNNSGIPIDFYNSNGIPLRIGELEQKIDGEWEKALPAPDFIIPPWSPPPLKKLLPGESHNYTWDQFLEIDYPVKLPGIYRFKFTFDKVGSVYSSEFEIQSVKQEVVITTDKTEYQREETIKITVINNSNEVICYDKRKGCGLPFWTLSQYQKNCSRENCWQEVTQVSPCIWEDTPPAKQLTVKEKIEKNWNQTIFAAEPSMLIESPIRRVDTGKYRFEFEYWSYSPGCPRPLGETPVALSNEFEIKEKVSQAENYCQKDEDCVLSSYKDNYCCPGCLTELTNKIHFEQQESWREENCKPRKEIDGSSCKMVSCAIEPPEQIHKAFCLNNLCSIVSLKKEGENCNLDQECQNILCSKYDTPVKEGYKPYCVEGKCKCMCYGCK